MAIGDSFIAIGALTPGANAVVKPSSNRVLVTGIFFSDGSTGNTLEITNDNASTYKIAFKPVASAVNRVAIVIDSTTNYLRVGNTGFNTDYAVTGIYLE